MRVLMLATLFVFGNCSLNPAEPTAQDSQKSQISEMSSVGQQIARLGLRPTISLQEGLKIAERFIELNHIDTTNYYLAEARMILSGSQNSAPLKNRLKDRRWFFWWMNEKGSIGNYIEISVDMDGRAVRHPSM